MAINEEKIQILKMVEINFNLLLPGLYCLLLSVCDI